MSALLLLREHLTHKIQSTPEFLLEHDGGPEGLAADLILATLLGHDEQVDAEWRIPRVEPYLLRPIVRRPSMSLAAPSSAVVDMPVARYNLQSNWAEMALSWPSCRHLLPADVRPDFATLMVRVALVRYKRAPVGASRIEGDTP